MEERKAHYEALLAELVEDLSKQLHEKLETRRAHRESVEEPVDLLRHPKQDDLTSMLSVKKMEKKWQHVDDSDYDSDLISSKGSQISGPSGLSFKSDESKDFFITFSQLLIEATETAKKSAERNEEAVIEYLSNNCLCGQGSDLSDSSSEKDSGYEERNSKKKGQCTCLNNPLLKSAQEERKRAENYIVDTMKLILQRSQCWTSAGSASQSDHSKDDAINFKKAEIRSLQDENMDKQKMEQIAKWCEAAGNTLIQQKPNPAPLAPRGRSMPTVANNFGPSSSSSYSAPVASVSPYMPTVANNFGPSSSSRDENMDTWKMEQTEEWCEAAGNTEIQPQPNSATAAPQIPCVPLVANNFGPSSSSIYSAPGPPQRLYMSPFAKNSGLSSAYFNSATAAPQIPCVPLVANNFGPNPSSIYSAPGPPQRLYMPPPKIQD